MTESERIEYVGLAATVGRLMSTLRQTEDELLAAKAELEGLRKDTDE